MCPKNIQITSGCGRWVRAVRRGGPALYERLLWSLAHPISWYGDTDHLVGHKNLEATQICLEVTDSVRLRENIELGQRVEEFELDRWSDGEWVTFEQATSIGACRLIRTENDIKTSRLRLRITGSAACPALSEFGVFLEG